ncbi:MAG: hypothetical protein QM428_07065, partial [Verrucomicrobiota bacterium]|nr:hypothetical protein [Verrucomicrobiota bacterium]
QTWQGNERAGREVGPFKDCQVTLPCAKTQGLINQYKKQGARFFSPENEQGALVFQGAFNCPHA